MAIPSFTEFESLDHLRAKAADKLLRILALAGLPILGLSIWQLALLGRWDIIRTLLVSYVSIALLALVRLPARIRVRLLLGCIWLTATIFLSRYGYYYPPITLGFIAPVLAALLVGLVDAVIIALLWIGSLLAAGYLFFLPGLVDLHTISLAPTRPVAWVLAAASTALLLMPLLVASISLVRLLETSLRNRAVLVSDLKQELATNQDIIAKLRHAEASLARNERLQAVALVAGTLAHDLNRALGQAGHPMCPTRLSFPNQFTGT